MVMKMKMRMMDVVFYPNEIEMGKGDVVGCNHHHNFHHN